MNIILPLVRFSQLVMEAARSLQVQQILERRGLGGSPPPLGRPEGLRYKFSLWRYAARSAGLSSLRSAFVAVATTAK